jgi:GT2 family glycosyltransferase
MSREDVPSIARGTRTAARRSRHVAKGVAVAIVNYNGGATLARCLRAVCRQSLAPERILLFDNASVDRSCDDVERRFPRVELRQLGENLGFADAANRAFREARGCRWVAILNADAIPSRRWLERALRAAQALPNCAAISSQLLSAADPRTLDGVGDVYHVSGAAWRSGHGQPVEADRPASGTQPREVFSACAAAALYRRQAVLRVGGFDESFFCYFEDVDLGYRLRLAGWKAWHVPRATAKHVGSGSTWPGSDFAVYHGHRNLVWSFFQNTPRSLFWRHLPQHLLWNLVTVAWFIAQGRGRLILRSKWDAVRRLPRIWRSRSNAPGAVGNLRQVMAAGWLRPYLRRK